eukprot:gene5684-5631_t
MKRLADLLETTPLYDHHAHPLLDPEAAELRQVEGLKEAGYPRHVVTEAGEECDAWPTSLAARRGLRNLAGLLDKQDVCSWTMGLLLQVKFSVKGCLNLHSRRDNSASLNIYVRHRCHGQVEMCRKQPGKAVETFLQPSGQLPPSSVGQAISLAGYLHVWDASPGNVAQDVSKALVHGAQDGHTK